MLIRVLDEVGNDGAKLAGSFSNFSYQIEIWSELPISKGLGSSASLAVSMVSAFTVNIFLLIYISMFSVINGVSSSYFLSIIFN